VRLLVLILLLGNLAFFAWARYVPESSSAESQLMSQQINPDSIKLLGVAPTTPRPPAAAKVVACMEWGVFGAADATTARDAVAPLFSAARITEQRQDEVAGWWVFMPPQPSRAGAAQKVEELKQLGVTEYFIVQDDPKLRFAISLGIFRTEEAARNRLDQLRGQGVRTAQVGPRTSAVSRVSLQIRDVPEPDQDRLRDLVKGYPGTSLSECGS
jgi:hypothetical protein